MRMRDEVLARMREYPDWLPQEALHRWRSTPDDGGHTHCENCRGTIYIDDPVVGTYLEFVSVVFCRVCVSENRSLLWDWMGCDPLADQ